MQDSMWSERELAFDYYIMTKILIAELMKWADS